MTTIQALPQRRAQGSIEEKGNRAHKHLIKTTDSTDDFLKEAFAEGVKDRGEIMHSLSWNQSLRVESTTTDDDSFDIDEFLEEAFADDITDRGDIKDDPELNAHVIKQQAKQKVKDSFNKLFGACIAAFSKK